MEKQEEEEEQVTENHSGVHQEDVHLKPMVSPEAREAQGRARARTQAKHEQLCELSCALAVLASASVKI